jgi:hypothetical protein
MTKFVPGMRVFSPNERTPSFIKATLAINKQELMDWLIEQEDQIKIDIKESKSGNSWFAEINTFKSKTPF